MVPIRPAEVGFCSKIGNGIYTAFASFFSGLWYIISLPFTCCRGNAGLGDHDVHQIPGHEDHFGPPVSSVVVKARAVDHVAKEIVGQKPVVVEPQLDDDLSELEAADLPFPPPGKTVDMNALADDTATNIVKILSGPLDEQQISVITRSLAPDHGSDLSGLKKCPTIEKRIFKFVDMFSSRLDPVKKHQLFNKLIVASKAPVKGHDEVVLPLPVRTPEMVLIENANRAYELCGSPLSDGQMRWIRLTFGISDSLWKDHSHKLLSDQIDLRESALISMIEDRTVRHCIIEKIRVRNPGPIFDVRYFEPPLVDEKEAIVDIEISLEVFQAAIRLLLGSPTEDAINEASVLLQDYDLRDLKGVTDEFKRIELLVKKFPQQGPLIFQVYYDVRPKEFDPILSIPITPKRRIQLSTGMVFDDCSLLLSILSQSIPFVNPYNKESLSDEDKKALCERFFLDEDALFRVWAEADTEAVRLIGMDSRGEALLLGQEGYVETVKTNLRNDKTIEMVRKVKSYLVSELGYRMR